MATIWRETLHGVAAETLKIICGSAVLDLNERSEHDRCQLRIVPFHDGNKPKHVLLVHHNIEVRVNGWPIIGGIQVLDHKDEIAIGRRRMFFSGESQPLLELYQHDSSNRRPRCPICRAEVEDEQQIVCCPGCSRIYHQITAT